MNVELLASILPAVYSLVMAAIYLPVIGPDGALAISSIGIGASLLLAAFMFKRR